VSRPSLSTMRSWGTSTSSTPRKERRSFHRVRRRIIRTWADNSPPACVTAAWKTTEPTQVGKIRPLRSRGTPTILVLGVLVDNVGRVRLPLHRARIGNMLLFCRQGGDGTRVFTVSSVLGPAKAQRCQTGPRPSLPKLSSQISYRFPVHMPWPQPIEQPGHCKPHRRPPPPRGIPDKYCECPSSTAKEAGSAPVCRVRQ
jgi:hypothetical protein